MIQRYLLIIAAAMAAILSACSDDSLFVVEGRLADGVDRQISLSFFDGNGYKVMKTTSIDGSFRLEAVAPAYSLVSIADQDNNLLASAIVRNGDEISLKLDPAEPINSRASGNKPTEAFDAFIHDNAESIIKGDAASINAAVVEYIIGHRDSPESAALLTSVFRTAGNEVLADSLLRLLGPKARSRPLLNTFPALLASQLAVEVTANISARTLPAPGGKTMRVIPRDASLTLFAFADDDANRLDSALVLLRDITSRFPRKRLRAIHLSSVSDSISWARKAADDSTAAYDRSWNPVLVADRQWKSLAVPSRPFYVVIDSTGTQRLRTASADGVRRFVDDFLSR